MTQRFEKAYNALLNAFMNDTLAKGSCAACAVGNIIADAMGGEVISRKNNYGDVKYNCSVENHWWSYVFVTSVHGQTIHKIKESPHTKEYRKRMFILTGYRWNELAKVEKVFEKNTKISHPDYWIHTEKQIMEDQFNGLMAVMDVLIKLDDIAEGNKYKDAFKTKLVKHEEVCN